VRSHGESVERRVAFIDTLVPLVGRLVGRRVLDIGCGRDALWTRAYLAAGAEVIAVELEPARCREALTRLAASPPDGPGRLRGLVCANGERLPLAPGSVDFVHCAQVLEHVASPAAFLEELRRVLVPCGVAYMTAISRFAPRDPHFGVIGVNWLPPRLGDRVLDWMGATSPEGQTLAEMHYFSRRGLRRLLAGSGLEMVVDLKRRERIARHGALGGRFADFWGPIRSPALHVLVRRPDRAAPARPEV
jgi:ubiquinone/menaquinone biosynthesis C-methylase UbiE